MYTETRTGASMRRKLGVKKDYAPGDLIKAARTAVPSTFKKAVIKKAVKGAAKGVAKNVMKPETKFVKAIAKGANTMKKAVNMANIRYKKSSVKKKMSKKQKMGVKGLC